MSWEIERFKKPRVAVGMLFKEETVYRDMVKAAFGFQREPGWIFFFQTSIPLVDVARNVVASQALHSGAEYLFFWDSVPSYTPVIARDPLTHEVDILPIEDLADFKEKGKEIQRVNLQVRTASDKWTPIKHVMRHPFRGQLYRVNVHSGLVDISGNHSICTGDKTPIKGADLKVGDKVSMPRIKLFRKPFGKRRKFFFGGKDVAWFYGFFAAEGCVSGISVTISNKDEGLISRCAEIFSKYFGLDLNPYRDGDVWKVGTCERRLAQFFKERFYTKSRLKRVPKEILNASPECKYSFLQGFNEGDGSNTIYGTQEFKEFSCDSQVLAEGLIWLIKGTTNQPCSVLAREDKDYVRISLPKKAQRDDSRLVKKILRIPYEGYLYDIETEDHRFMGGVGGILLHNSDIVPPYDIVPRLVAHGLPVVSALYWRRHPNIFPEVFRVHPKTGIPEPMKPEEVSLLRGQLIECDAVGLGCCLIHRSVLEKLAERSNKFTMTSPDNPDETLEVVEFMKMIMQDRVTISEDVHFCSRVKHELGFKIFMDLGIECAHLCGAQVKDGKMDFPALEYGRER